MIIRSQDKKTISDDMNLKIQGRKIGKIEFFNIRNSKDICLGTYKTIEKAIKVLDMIQQEFCDYGENGAFNMPSDEEVEV